MIISFENYHRTKTTWLDKTSFFLFKQVSVKQKEKNNTNFALKPNNKYIIWLFSFSKKKNVHVNYVQKSFLYMYKISR